MAQVNDDDEVQIVEDPFPEKRYIDFPALPSSYKGEFIVLLHTYMKQQHLTDKQGTGRLHAFGGIRSYLKSLIANGVHEDLASDAKKAFIKDITATDTTS
jgi:hypothetical protein